MNCKLLDSITTKTYVNSVCYFIKINIVYRHIIAFAVQASWKWLYYVFLYIFRYEEITFISAFIACRSQKVESQSETPYAVYRSGTYERTRRPVDSMYPESEDGHYATIDEPNHDYTELQFQQPQPQRPGIAPVPPPSYPRGRRDNLSDRSYLDLRSTTSEVPVPESRVPPPRDNWSYLNIA